MNNIECFWEGLGEISLRDNDVQIMFIFRSGIKILRISFYFLYLEFLIKCKA